MNTEQTSKNTFMYIVFIFIIKFYCTWGYNFTSADFEKNIFM